MPVPENINSQMLYWKLHLSISYSSRLRKKSPMKKIATYTKITKSSSLNKHYHPWLPIILIKLQLWKLSTQDFHSALEIKFLSKINLPSLYFWLYSRAQSYFHPSFEAQFKQNKSLTQCKPVLSILSWGSPILVL